MIPVIKCLFRALFALALITPCEASRQVHNLQAGRVGINFLACWLKTKAGPSMGGYLTVDGVLGAEFVQSKLRLNVARKLSDHWPSSMLSSWTHLALTFDGTEVRTYRNGVLISSAPLPPEAKINWGKTFSLGGKSPYGNAEVSAQSLYFYKSALAADAIENLYLWGRYGAAKPVR